jgi:hypothetical protein
MVFASKVAVKHEICGLAVLVPCDSIAWTGKFSPTIDEIKVGSIGCS